MNKTIIINITGIIFHIEEDAYELLKNYINQVKKHFSSSDDSFEIITDIETRIAEMFTELLKKDSRQVIVSEDVKGIIAKMGNVSDFETDEEGEETTFNSPQTTEKARLYRHPDDNIIGGVCGGIAAYFDFDPLWLRLGWALSIILAGFGLLLYIILWIIIPKAETRAEKLAMKGKPVNLSNIKESVENEVNDLKRNDRFSRAGSKAKKAGAFIENLFKLVFEVIGKVIGFFCIFFGSIIQVALFIALMVLLGFSDAKIISLDFLPMLAEPDLQPWIYICYYLAVVIPFLGLILLGLRLMSGKSYAPRFSGVALSGIWIIALIGSLYFGMRLATSFKEEARIRVTDTLALSDNKTYYLNLNRKGSWVKSAGSHHEINIDHDGFDWNCLNFHLEKSENGKLELEKVFSARGKTMEKALQNAEMMAYSYQQQDSVITFSDQFNLNEKAYYRAQELTLTLRVPEGSKVVINENLRGILDSYWWYDCEDFNGPTTVLYVEKTGIHCAEDREEKEKF